MGRYVIEPEDIARFLRRPQKYPEPYLLVQAMITAAMQHLPDLVSHLQRQGFDEFAVRDALAELMAEGKVRYVFVDGDDEEEDYCYIKVLDPNRGQYRPVMG